MSTVISVENLSKKYRLGAIGSATLKDDVARLWAKLRGQDNPSRQVSHDDRVYPRDHIWALSDVSFSVKQGEVLGIIGRNGAGKSTLLKILSQVTTPTSGEIKIRGRVSSLLEVGTGFHPELTGRENIFLNGAILGMTKTEIRRKLDDIIDFSEIDRFIDTPVKRYSSGMSVRLAFAVAAHLEPEILILDEVLAVGDVSFQKKCFGKMNDVASRGRTILFVSHDLSSATKLCSRGILLNNGRIEFEGEMSAVASYYTKDEIRQDGRVDLSQRGDRSGRGDAQFGSIELTDGAARTGTFPIGSRFQIRVGIKVNRAFLLGHIAITIKTSDGVAVHPLENLNEGLTWSPSVGLHVFEVTVDSLQLSTGAYWLDVWIGEPQVGRIDYVKRAIDFQVIQTAGSGIQQPFNRSDGLVFVRSHWRHSIGEHR